VIPTGLVAFFEAVNGQVVLFAAPAGVVPMAATSPLTAMAAASPVPAQRLNERM
jgi:hypothetical protein